MKLAQEAIIAGIVDQQFQPHSQLPFSSSLTQNQNYDSSILSHSGIFINNKNNNNKSLNSLDSSAPPSSLLSGSPESFASSIGRNLPAIGTQTYKISNPTILSLAINDFYNQQEPGIYLGQS